MKKITLIILLISYFTIQSQNLIQNPEFLNGDYLYPPGVDDIPAWNFDEDNCDFWEGRAYDNNTTRLHSPDWYEMYSYRYIAIRDYELIQQHLDDNLEPAKSYEVNCEIKISFLDFDNSKLVFYISKKKIKYGCEWQFCERCSADYMAHKTNQIGQHTIIMKEFDLSEYSVGYHTIQFIFNTPNNDFNNYDWFTIEVVNIENWEIMGLTICDGQKLGIYEVTMEEVDYCTYDPCSRTDGPIIPSVPFWVPVQGAPYGLGIMQVDGLDNVFEAKNIVIRNFLGQYVVREIPNIFSVNGITEPIYWDGRNDAGTLVANTTYVWEMDLYNDCNPEFPFKYSVSFVKLNDFWLMPQYTDYINIKLPLQCCINQPDLEINDLVLEGQGLLDFIAINSVSVANILPVVVESTAEEVLFQAGESINLYPGFSASSGSHVNIIIDDCIQQGIISTSSFNYFPNSQLDDVITNVDSFTIDSFQINNGEVENFDKIYELGNNHITYPIPCSDLLHIDFNNEISLIKLEIRDNNGHLILLKNYRNTNEILLNIKSLNIGVYYLSLFYDNYWKCEKIIKL